MNIKEIQEQAELLDKMLAIFNEDGEDETQHDVFYGVVDGKEGWHVVIEDYPSYSIHFLAKTFEEAEAEIAANWMD